MSQANGIARVDDLTRAWTYAILIDENRPAERWYGHAPDGRIFAVELVTVPDIRIVAFWANTPNATSLVGTFRQLDDARAIMAWLDYRHSQRRKQDGDRVSWLTP